MNKVTFQSKDGLKLVGIWAVPTQSTNKAVVMAHGLSVNKDESGLFIKLAETLREDGFAVFRFDFRGRPESEGKAIDMTIKGELLDLDAAIEEAINKNYNRVGLLGASFGGSIATLYTSKNQNKLKCLCLWNPVLNYDHTFINPFLPWLINDINDMKKDISQKGWTTLGKKNYIIGKGLFNEMTRLFPYDELKKISIPTIIIHGDKDTYVPFEDSKKYAKNLKNGVFIKIEGAEHGFHQEPFETQVVNITLDFFKKYL